MSVGNKEQQRMEIYILHPPQLNAKVQQQQQQKRI